MTSSPPLLPLIPIELLKRHHVAEPTDTRFRAAARLRQSLWREAQGYPCGRYVDPKGRSRRLGSRLTPLIEGGFVALSQDRLAATAAGRQRLNAVLAALLD